MKFYLIVFTILFSIILNAQEQYKLDQITVMANKVPVSINNNNREIIILDELQLKKFYGSSLDYVLKELSGLDIRQRGIDGVQSDISVRGGTFEQTLIMIDGIKISDPQTGHHNFNLPLTINDIQRIEIIKGQASKSFGPNAFSGVINIITKKFSQDEINLGLNGGSNNSFKTELSLSNRIKNFYNRLSFSKSKSDGYRRNTEYEILNLFYSTNYSINNYQALFSFGYLDKNFGANSFYSIKYPDQAERTITKFASFQNMFILNDLEISSKLYWRRNDDNFVLNKFNPAFYKNLHQTNIYGTTLQIGFEYGVSKFTIGSEIIDEEIQSTNLGMHQRLNYGIFFESLSKLSDRIKLGLGGFAYSLHKQKIEFWPGLDFKYSFNENIDFTSSIGKAFRAPSFTELFYHDPITESNPNLRREESTNIDFGINYKNNLLISKSSFFIKKEKNLIDWVRNSSEEKWLAKNISEANIYGFESDLLLNLKSLNLNSFVKSINSNYTYLAVDKNSGYNFSKYALENLKHKFLVGFSNELFWDVEMQTQFYFEARKNYTAQNWIDFSFTKTFNDFVCMLKIKNAFNNKLYDFLNIELPRRIFSISLYYGISY